jgi:hypothetical protein
VADYLDGQLELFDPLIYDLGGLVMGKVIKEGDEGFQFAKGGTTKMFGKGTAGEAESGQSGKDSNDPSGGKEEFAEGGKTHMFGKGHANKAESGQSGKTSQ